MRGERPYSYKETSLRPSHTLNILPPSQTLDIIAPLAHSKHSRERWSEVLDFIFLLSPNLLTFDCTPGTDSAVLTNVHFYKSTLFLYWYQEHSATSSLVNVFHSCIPSSIHQMFYKEHTICQTWGHRCLGWLSPGSQQAGYNGSSGIQILKADEITKVNWRLLSGFFALVIIIIIRLCFLTGVN